MSENCKNWEISSEAPTGASVVCVNICLLGVLTLIRKIRLLNIKTTLRKVLTVVTVLLSVVLMLLLLVQGESFSYKKHNTSVVATTFAPCDFARQIASDCADVTMLLAPGEESHTYEPSPGDIMKIKECDVFIYGGGESEKWVDSILETVNSDVEVIRMMDVVELHETEHSHGAFEEHHHDEETEYDEHVWTSPLNAVEIVKALSVALQRADSKNSDVYQSNTEEYINELLALDKSIETAVKNANKNLIIIGDRFPLMYFTERYGLHYESAFPGCSAQAEANPAKIAELVDTVVSEEINTVFKVDLSSGNIADTVCEATDAKVATLYSCHVISADDFTAGETYISLMLRNLNALETALN